MKKLFAGMLVRLAGLLKETSCVLELPHTDAVPALQGVGRVVNSMTAALASLDAPAALGLR